MGRCKFDKLRVQPIQNLQTNNQQVIYKTKNEKQASEEDRYLNFDNYFKYKSEKQYWKAEISNDEKYLAILGSQFNKLQIYYLKNKKIIKIIQLKNKERWQYESIKFSINSRHLLFADFRGYLYCYDINDNFLLIYNQRLHSSLIIDILTIDDDQILTCSDDRSLIIANIKSNQYLLKIQNAHKSVINGIDFDKSNGFIISCSSDYSIKFFNRKDGNCQIVQKNAHSKEGYGIEKVQLISKDNYLISCGRRQLIFWQIDYRRLQLNKLKRLYNDRIYNFTSVLNNNKLVVIWNESIRILDKDLVVLQSIRHNTQMYSIMDVYVKTKQLNSLYYIIIPGTHDLLILKKVRRIKR